MTDKYNIKDSTVGSSMDKVSVTDKEVKDMEKFIDNLDKIKELDEQNPLEQAMKYHAVKQNPPEKGYMEVRCYEDKDEKNRPIVVSESDKYDKDDKLIGVKRFKHDPFFVVDLNTLLLGDITSCPSSTGPMLIDMAQKLVELKKRAFKTEERKNEFNWWWIVLAMLLIPGILTVVFMMLGGK